MSKKNEPTFIEKAKEAGNDHIWTRSGDPVRILCFDREDKCYPIIALIRAKVDGEYHEYMHSYTKDGKSHKDGKETPVDLIID